MSTLDIKSLYTNVPIKKSLNLLETDLTYAKIELPLPIHNFIQVYHLIRYIFVYLRSKFSFRHVRLNKFIFSKICSCSWVAFRVLQLNDVGGVLRLGKSLLFPRYFRSSSGVLVVVQGWVLLSITVILLLSAMVDGHA